METKIIHWKEEFTKLFPETTKRELKDNYKWCDKCNGVGWIKDGVYISFCQSCMGKGQIELCSEKCGRETLKYNSMCKECKETKDHERLSKLASITYEKAEKIQYKEYDGMFLIDERVMDNEDFEQYLSDKIYDGEEPENYVYGTNKEKIMTIDFRNIISNSCEDGYEDMDTYLNYEGVEEIQNMIDKWIEKQGNYNYTYFENKKLAVLLDDLIASIKEEIKNGNS